jgi:GNAT superfamily N-acetyltransferase
MIGIQIVPFQDEHLPAAGKLLAQRQRRDRSVSPELPERFEQPKVAAAAVRAALARENAAGFVALDNGRLVAFLIGDMVIDNIWGRSGWVRAAGCAYDPEVEAEIIRDLYAVLGARWVAFGIFFHFALIPVSDPALIGAWFSLSFGVEHIHALQDLSGLGPRRLTIADGIELRPAGPADGPQLAQMSDVIWSTQVKAPVWAVKMPESVAGTARAWAELGEDDEVTLWLAVRGDRVLAVQGYWPAQTDDDSLFVPENCAHMSVAGTRAEARNQGLNTLLSNKILSETSAAGYHHIETDWRSTNLLASRFWPQRGYRPVAYRLVRRLDQRIAWADGSAPS